MMLYAEVSMTVEVITRKWGNSLGVILPKEVVVDQNLRPNERVSIVIIKHPDLKHMHGILPRKMSGQAFKDLARSGWEK